MDANTQKMWDIARQVYQQLGSRFGVNQTPTHTHNDVDSPKLDPSSLTNVKQLSAQTGFVMAGNTPSNIKGAVAVFPIPILPGIPTGIAPDGTLVLGFDSGVTKLYARVNNAWVAIYH